MKRQHLFLAALGAALAYLGLRRAGAGRWAASVRTYSMPTAGLYDAIAGWAMGGFYRRVAREVAEACPAGRALDVGCGPGHLAVELARAAPNLSVVGVDILPEMVERANRRAERAGVAGRVRFEVGDASALPFAGGSFDVVVSTLSLHHWADPERGLAEVYRVLRPGGQALIYDIAAWLRRFHEPGPDLAPLVAASPFGHGQVETVRWPDRLALLRRARLRRG